MVERLDVGKIRRSSQARRGGDPAGSVDWLEQQQLEPRAGDSQHTDE